MFPAEAGMMGTSLAFNGPSLPETDWAAGF